MSLSLSRVDHSRTKFYIDGNDTRKFRQKLTRANERAEPCTLDNPRAFRHYRLRKQTPYRRRSFGAKSTSPARARGVN